MFLAVWLKETVIENGTTEREKIEFCKGRKFKKNYTTFFSRFIPAVVGPDLFRERLHAKDEVVSPEAICTISDEAFALLLIENSYDRWTDIFAETGGIPKQQRGVRKREYTSDVPPKYTQGGIKYSEGNQKQTKGWTNQGIQRYNELFKMVTEDRRHKKFLIKFKKQQGDSKPKQLKDKPATIKAVHSLWKEDDKELVEQNDVSSCDDASDDDDVVD